MTLLFFLGGMQSRTIINESFFSAQFKSIPDSLFIVSFLILSILIVLVFLSRKNHRATRHSVFSMLLVEYVFLMFCSTVICRESKDTYHLELMPFWNYHDVLFSGKPMRYWEVILNFILYYPIGFLLGCLYKRIVPTVLICVVLSVITEVLQLVLHRGLCETDDVIHNTIGGFLGYWMYLWVVKGVRCARA